MKKLAIIGKGGHALVVASILALNKDVKIVGFIDKKSERGKLSKLDNKTHELLIAIGNNSIRAGAYNWVKRLGFKVTSAIHPSAIISPDAVLGEGLVICAGAIICTKAVIGDNSIINTGATIDHEVVIGKHCHIAPGVHIAGKVKVGDFTLIGIGSSVIPNIKIGRNSIIGAGAVVVSDILDNSLAVGVPAKVIKKI